MKIEEFPGANRTVSFLNSESTTRARCGYGYANGQDDWGIYRATLQRETHRDHQNPKFSIQKKEEEIKAGCFRAGVSKLRGSNTREKKNDENDFLESHQVESPTAGLNSVSTEVPAHSEQYGSVPADTPGTAFPQLPRWLCWAGSTVPVPPFLSQNLH